MPLSASRCRSMMDSPRNGQRTSSSMRQGCARPHCPTVVVSVSWPLSSHTVGPISTTFDRSLPSGAAERVSVCDWVFVERTL